MRQDHTTHEGEVTLWFDVTIARPPSRRRRPHDSDTYWLGVFLEGGSFGPADPEGVWESEAPTMLRKKGMGVETCESVQVSSQALAGEQALLVACTRPNRYMYSGKSSWKKQGCRPLWMTCTLPTKRHGPSPAMALAAATCTPAQFLLSERTAYKHLYGRQSLHSYCCSLCCYEVWH